MSMTITQIIDPFEIATQGISSNDAITIATNGFIVFITEEIIDDIIPRRGGAADATLVMGPYDHYKENSPKKKKRITAIVIIDGIEYSDTVESEDLTLTAKDISIEVTNAPTPQLKITVMRGNT